MKLNMMEESCMILCTNGWYLWSSVIGTGNACEFMNVTTRHVKLRVSAMAHLGDTRSVLDVLMAQRV